MRLFFKTLALTLVFSVALSVPIWAGESGQKPLNEVFDSIAVVPVDYHDKVFLNGQKTDVLGDYQIHQRNGRVLVPVRLMGYLMAGTDNSHCEVIWDPQKPEDVTLINQGLKQRVKLTVNSNTMYINDEPQALDVPPQKINGRIVLPLRSASQALGKNVQWFDGLVFISDGVVGLESPQTTEIVEQIRKKLSDERKELAYEKKVTPVIKYGDTVYYTKTIYDQGGQTEELYKKTGAGAEMKVELPGEKRFGRSKIFNGELYYLAKINGNSELHIFNFAGNKWRKLCDLEQWNPGDGWLAGMELIDNEFYVVLHFGDLTMGYETLYKLENGVLREIAGAKSFIDFDVEGGFLYYTDFHPMNWTENLFRVNMETGEKETLGEKDFTYGISRTIQNQGGTSYSSNSAFYIKNGYIYTLGYKESDGEDRASVYKISLDGKTRDKLTPPVRTFWLVDNEIYYIDLDTGYLLSVDTEGNNKKTLVDRNIIDLKFFKENIYYTAGRTMVPVRWVAESLGADVKWDERANSVTVTTKDVKPEIVAGIPDKEVILSAVKNDGMYEDFILRVKGSKRFFDWKNTSNPTYAPKLLLKDVDRNGQKELIIILTTGTGTGVYVTEAHVINLETLSEAYIDDPKAIVLKNVKSKITGKEVEIVIGDRKTVIDIEKLNIAPKNLFSNIAFGNICRFEVINDELRVNVGAQISPVSFIGDVQITYTFKENMYQASKIKFIEEGIKF